MPQLQPGTPCLSRRCTYEVTVGAVGVVGWVCLSEHTAASQLVFMIQEKRVAGNLTIYRGRSGHGKTDWETQAQRNTSPHLSPCAGHEDTRVSGGTDPPILNLCSKRRPAVSYTSRPLYFPRNSCRRPLNKGYVDPRTDTDILEIINGNPITKVV